MRRYLPFVEALGLLVVTFALAVGLRLPTLWLVVPFILITFTDRPYAEYGVTLRRPGSLRFHTVVITAVFIPYAIGHYALAHWAFGMHFRFRLPPHLLQSVFDQVVIIGLSEEFFFRGYLQTQCDRVWGTPYRLLGAQVGIGLPLAAALFAICHVFFGGPIRLIVFFPGLLYGWLRERTDTIAVPALYHAGSNLLMEIMLASLSR